METGVENEVRVCKYSVVHLSIYLKLLQQIWIVSGPFVFVQETYGNY